MTDTFSINTVEITHKGEDVILTIRRKARELESLINQVKCREASLAMTNLEQAVMWSVKAIVISEEWKE